MLGQTPAGSSLIVADTVLVDIVEGNNKSLSEHIDGLIDLHCVAGSLLQVVAIII